MYINWILKSQKPRNSNLVWKNRENNYFLSRTKLEVIRYCPAIKTIFLDVKTDVKEGILRVAAKQEESSQIHKNQNQRKHKLLHLANLPFKM